MSSIGQKKKKTFGICLCNLQLQLATCNSQLQLPESNSQLAAPTANCNSQLYYSQNTLSLCCFSIVHKLKHYNNTCYLTVNYFYKCCAAKSLNTFIAISKELDLHFVKAFGVISFLIFSKSAPRFIICSKSFSKISKISNIFNKRMNVTADNNVSGFSLSQDT